MRVALGPRTTMLKVGAAPIVPKAAGRRVFERWCSDFGPGYGFCRVAVHDAVG